jgi:hypothetical protein
MGPKRGVLIATMMAELARITAVEAADDATNRARCRASYEQAQTLRRDERLEAARAQLLICKETCPDALVTECGKWLAEVDALMPTVRLTAKDQDGKPLTDVRVTIDGHAALEPFGGALSISPGDHRFRFERRGSVPAEVHADVHAGERDHAIAVVLSPVEVTAPVTKAAPSRTPALVATGIGAALLAAGGALAIKGHVDRSTLRSTCAPYCSDEAIDSVRTQWWVAGGLAIAGAAAVGLAVVLWPRQPDGRRAMLTVNPRAVALSVPLP